MGYNSGKTKSRLFFGILLMGVTIGLALLDLDFYSPGLFEATIITLWLMFGIWGLVLIISSTHRLFGDD